MNEVMACNRVAARLTAPSQRPDFLGGTSAEFMPLPDSWTVCGLFSALSVKINDDLRFSFVVGAKITSTTQLFCASMVAPVQVSSHREILLIVSAQRHAVDIEFLAAGVGHRQALRFAGPFDHLIGEIQMVRCDADAWRHLLLCGFNLMTVGLSKSKQQQQRKP